MEFPMASVHESFDGMSCNISVENLKTEEPGEEVQYMYDENEFIMGGTGDYNNITDLVLEDGTKAMIVNGTLVTADGQTLILQDGSDLSQYSVDDNTDEILISKEQEDQFLQIMNPHAAGNDNSAIVHYFQDESGNDQQILCIQDGDNIIPIQGQYQIAQLDPDSTGDQMQILKFQNDQTLEDVNGVIDLEQLLLSQQGAIQLDGGNYQYAVLKDGRFHLQVTNDAMDLLGAPVLGNSGEGIILNQSDVINPGKYLDLSIIKGRNVKTGQAIRLSQHVDKSANKKLKSEYNLKKLINKKITIGQTDKGKMLVGKIVNVIKKADVKRKKNQVAKENLKKSSQPIKKSASIASGKLKEILRIAGDEVISLINDDESNRVEEIITNPVDTDYNLEQPKTDTCYPPQTTTSSTQNINQESNAILSNISSSEDAVAEDTLKSAEDKNSTTEIPKTNNENSSEYSKIIVHQKVVTKDCFDVITRTLTGLMNMDSVVKKLKNKTIIIKIIEKTYSQVTKDYMRTISYCSGYMVREYKLDDNDGSFSESWRFIPDTNSKETILGQNNLEAIIQDGSTSHGGLKKFANLTIQITVTPEGNKTTRVIINPPALFQCKACSKSFRTSALLKVHSIDCHGIIGLEHSDCLLKLKTVADAKDHSKSNHLGESNKCKYECMECNKSFQTSAQIRKHMALHYKPSTCSICKLSLPTMKDLNKHMLTHSDSHLPQLFDEPTVKEDDNDKLPPRKVYICHICTRQFSRHSNLQRHIEIHQGEGAMYQCAICSCSYHYISSLTRHVVSCHMDKSKKFRPNANEKQTNPLQNINIITQEQELQFLQDNQIVQMIPLEQITEESLQQYVTEDMEYVTQDLEGTGDEVQILQIPVDSRITIED